MQLLEQIHITSSSSGINITLQGGIGGNGNRGGVQGPLRNNVASTGGTASIAGTVLPLAQVLMV